MFYFCHQNSFQNGCPEVNRQKRCSIDFIAIVQKLLFTRSRPFLFFVFVFVYTFVFLFISPVILLFSSFVFPSLTRFQYVILQCGEEQGFNFQRVTNNRANLPLELNSCSKLIISFSLRKGITNTIFNNYYQLNQQNLSSI